MPRTTGLESPENADALLLWVELEAMDDAVAVLARGIHQMQQDTLRRTSLTAVFSALKAYHAADDAAVYSRTAEIFSGMLNTGRASDPA
jgi:hypothetical protein